MGVVKQVLAELVKTKEWSLSDAVWAEFPYKELQIRNHPMVSSDLTGLGRSQSSCRDKDFLLLLPKKSRVKKKKVYYVKRKKFISHPHKSHNIHITLFIIYMFSCFRFLGFFFFFLNFMYKYEVWLPKHKNSIYY